mgnify:FL=1
MREMFQGRFKKLYIALFMLLFLTGCSSEEILSEVPQTIVLPVEEIDSLPGQEAEETTAESDNTESCSLLEEGGSRFAYESLDAQEQIWYGEIEQALGEMTDTVKLSTEPIGQGLDEQDIDRIFQCVLIDHPEIFYTTGYTYTKYSRGDRTVGIDFAGTYSLPREEAVNKAEEIRERASEWLSDIPSDASEYDKVKAVYEKIIFSTDYDLNASDNQNIASVFLGNSSVCQGYAKATQYLLNHLGVMCTLVQGTVDTGEAHAWNLVRVDGDYYYVDTTWGDASYRMEDGSGQEELPEINYDYLCVTTQELLRTHCIESVVAMPECTATQANYYVREGVYFTSYDAEQMQSIFDRAWESGRTEITLKCADEECYREICRVLIDEQEIFSYMQENSSTIAYAQNGKQLSLTFWVTNE